MSDAASRRNPTKNYLAGIAATWVKLVGGLILLLSFGTQHLLFDVYNSRAATIRTGMLERAVIDKGAQLSELLYLTFPAALDSALGGVRWQKIQEAARKQAYSSIMPLASNDSITKREAVDRANLLLRQASDVRDYRSYLNFLEDINRSNAVFATAWQPELDRIEASKARWRRIYLGFYAIGTILILASQAAEGLHKAREKRPSARTAA